MQLESVSPLSRNAGFFTVHFATDLCLSHSSKYTHVAPLASSLLKSEATTRLMSEDRVALEQQAKQEMRIAGDLIVALCNRRTVPEVETYMQHVRAHLHAVSETDLVGNHFWTAFGDGLRSARIILTSSVTSYPLWLELAQVINPDAAGHLVPARFVVKDDGEQAESVVFDPSDAKVEELVSQFLGDDGHSTSSRL